MVGTTRFELATSPTPAAILSTPPAKPTTPPMLPVPRRPSARPSPSRRTPGRAPLLLCTRSPFRQRRFSQPLPAPPPRTTSPSQSMPPPVELWRHPTESPSTLLATRGSPTRLALLSASFPPAGASSLRRPQPVLPAPRESLSIAAAMSGSRTPLATQW